MAALSEMEEQPRVLTLHGEDMVKWLEDVARMRCEVFRDFPYLYDGDEAYEQQYLSVYTRSPGSVLVLALAAGRVVGASTGLPLKDAEPAFQRPFQERGIPLETVFYCGESVLLPAFRGRGLGHRFFDEREAHARSLKSARWVSFASVIRAATDPRRPVGYRSNESFWSRRGYVPQPDMEVRLPWKQVGETHETEQALTMWLRPLESMP